MRRVGVGRVLLFDRCLVRRRELTLIPVDPPGKEKWRCKWTLSYGLMGSLTRLRMRHVRGEIIPLIARFAGVTKPAQDYLLQEYVLNALANFSENLLRVAIADRVEPLSLDNTTSYPVFRNKGELREDREFAELILQPHPRFGEVEEELEELLEAHDDDHVVTSNSLFHL